MASSSSSSSSLCLSEASQKFKDKTITQEEYYQHILAHCTGYLHDEDDDSELSQPSSLQDTDPFAYAVQCFMKRKDFIKNNTPLEEAFKALDQQDVQAIKGAAAKLDGKQHAQKFLYQILALRALQLRKARVLKYCLDMGGFPYEAYFEDEADRVREEKDPLTFKVLEESQFSKLYPRKEEENEQGEDDDSSLGAEERDRRERDRAAAAFDEGGEFPVDW
ncbi:hypothetical protein QBC37DRAFT_377336 [Rhypophila decipiens]|uniref:Uncharacterized protein n=1 Tax=Rhypophila decipiens TaxID=261697 RepID=A0AAN7B2C0_9PEZI|nr:hypothetical protein QBC37DRAFT_377336 [Rhypophila decipiens]